MATYDEPSTHPHALVATLLPTGRTADPTAAHLEREIWRTSTDISAEQLPNTVIVYVTSSDGTLSTFLHKTGSFGPSSSVLIDQDGRAFVLAQTITATATNVAVGNALSVSIILHDAEMSQRWLDAGKLATAITFNDATLAADSALSADPLALAINLQDATFYADWLAADTLNVAVTLNDASLLGTELRADPLSVSITFNDADLFLSGPLSADALAVAINLQDATLFLGGFNATTLSTAITFNAATLQFVGDLILTSGDAQSGSDAIDLSGDEAPGSLLVSGS